MTTRILGGKGNRTRRSQKASCRATTSRRPPTRYERSHTRKVNLCIIQVTTPTKVDPSPTVTRPLVTQPDGCMPGMLFCNAGVCRVGMKATLEREAAKENTPHTARMAHDQLPPGVLWSSGLAIAKLATRSRVIGLSKRRRTAKTATFSHRSFWRLVRRFVARASVARASLRCGPRAPRRSMGSLRCASM